MSLLGRASFQDKLAGKAQMQAIQKLKKYLTEDEVEQLEESMRTTGQLLGKAMQLSQKK